MTLNRYRLRHLARKGHAGAKRAERLLERPDRLIGLILLGNNFVNILASSLATVIALRLLGEPGIAVAAGLLTLVILIFAEVAPKTLAALTPEKLAFPAAFVYTPLLKVLYPLVWSVNLIANAVLRLLGADPNERQGSALSSEELRTVVSDEENHIHQDHQKMLVSILDLERATVSDIMIPRNEVVGIDIERPLEEITQQLSDAQYTRMPVYKDTIDDVVGIIHVRRALNSLLKGHMDIKELNSHIRDAYFIPESTSLTQQLMNFRNENRRIAYVVDEYGDIQGLVTLEDILEEIVGEFTTDPGDNLRDVHPEGNGAYLVDGSAHIRELNRTMGWELPVDGPKTLSGLITEYMQTIPEQGTSVKLAGYPVEIIQTKDNIVKMARILPNLRKDDETSND